MNNNWIFHEVREWLKKQKNVSYIINNNLKDPRINGLISVTGVTVTRDLRNAKIFLSLYGDKTKQNDVFEAIKNAKGFIRERTSQHG